MSKKYFIAGNWKMNNTTNDSKKLIKELIELLKNKNNVDIAICPTFLSIPTTTQLTIGTNIKVGGQNLHWEEKGAYTGELSAEMLKEAGCEYVIIGHSERRQYFGETNETVNKKIKAAFRAGLKPIICVGETLEERESNKAFDVIKSQLQFAIIDITETNYPVSEITIAYEPVWAIGTGKTATPDQAQEIHAFIRKLLIEKYGETTANDIRIQYGGSVKPENAQDLFSKPDINGALVGGASLKATMFKDIIESC